MDSWKEIFRVVKIPKPGKGLRLEGAIHIAHSFRGASGFGSPSVETALLRSSKRVDEEEEEYMEDGMSLTSDME
jgi:hypothetical protein